MERKKRQWWLLGILAVLLLGIVGFAFRDAILIRAAQKAVLTSALNDLFSQLEQRFQGDPLLIVAGSLDPEGKYTIDMEMATEKELLGPVSYDMTLRTDGTAHQLFAEGTASTSSKVGTRSAVRSSLRCFASSSVSSCTPRSSPHTRA